MLDDSLVCVHMSKVGLMLSESADQQCLVCAVEMRCEMKESEENFVKSMQIFNS